MLQRLAAIAALTATGSEAPAAQAAAAVEAAERVAADRRGCVAAIAAIPSGRAAALGPQQLGSGIVWDELGHIIVPYAPLTRLQRQGTAGDPTVGWQPPLSAWAPKALDWQPPPCAARGAACPRGQRACS